MTSKTASQIAARTAISLLHSCPIARIEAERRASPMAQLVRHTTRAPAFA